MRGKLSADTTVANLDANANAMNADGQSIITFLNNLVQASNQAITSQSVSSSQLSAFQATAGSARSEVVAALASLAAQKSAYDSAISGRNSSNSANTGSQNDVAAAQANVKQALGALRSAQANLEKTIVRSPISGTIVSLPVNRGDFVSSFAQVAQVSNPGALEIVAYVTSDDAKTLAVGGKATIGDTAVVGVITSIAPALDPTTGKIQVKVGITGTQSTLTDGDTVTVSLVRTTDTSTTNNTTPSAPSAIHIPIIAAKITPTGAVVFTVSSSTLVAHPIVLGSILGEQITVVSGVTADMDIVTDARGLADGQTVVVDAN